MRPTTEIWKKLVHTDDLIKIDKKKVYTMANVSFVILL